jgi:hypothetical protein
MSASGGKLSQQQLSSDNIGKGGVVGLVVFVTCPYGIFVARDRHQALGASLAFFLTTDYAELRRVGKGEFHP